MFKKHKKRNPFLKMFENSQAESLPEEEFKLKYRFVRAVRLFLWLCIVLAASAGIFVRIKKIF